ncbi:hypothetical protein EKL29_21530, partial [Pantoea sp. YU22]
MPDKGKRPAIVEDLCNEMDLSPTRKKDRKKGCAIKSDPYNAPPLTRHNGLRSAVFRRLRQLS